MKGLSLITVPILLAACGGEDWALVEDLGAWTPAPCERLAGPEPGPVEIARLRAASDSTLLLVDPGAREIVELAPTGTRVATLTLAEDGPIGVALPSDAVRSGDTLVVVADAGRQRLRGFGADGRDLWTVQLDFPPQRLAFAGGRLLITAAGMDGRLPALVYELVAGQVRPLEVPPARHVDAIGRLFLNDVAIEGYPDGSALVAHHFVRPRGWRVGADGTVEALDVPVAAAIESSIGHLPPIPFREQDMASIAAPVIASAADPRTGDVLYLTRTGRQRDGRSEKALVRADAHFRYLASRRLEMNAVVIGYVPSHPDEVVVVDFDGDWFRCESP